MKKHDENLYYLKCLIVVKNDANLLKINDRSSSRPRWQKGTNAWGRLYTLTKRYLTEQACATGRNDVKQLNCEQMPVRPQWRKTTMLTMGLKAHGLEERQITDQNAFDFISETIKSFLPRTHAKPFVKSVKFHYICYLAYGPEHPETIEYNAFGKPPWQKIGPQQPHTTEPRLFVG